MPLRPLPGRVRAGFLLWALQPLYLVIELVGAALSTAPYSLLHSTISDLGATTCTAIAYPTEDVLVCSPAHAALNASFVVFGLAMALGAVLLRPWLPPGAAMSTATVLWVVTGASSIGTGLTPLDQALTLHALVSTPGIVLSGAAMALTGIALARSWQRPAWWGLAAGGILSCAAGILLLVRLDTAWIGLLERLCLWPSYAACTLVALAVLGRHPHGRAR